VHPDQGYGEDKKSLHLPPFPEVNLNWQGFTISHLSWLGIKVPKSNSNTLSNREERQVELVIDHEFGHQKLAKTPFSMVKKRVTFRFYELIFTIFGEELAQIPVPVIPDKWGSPLQKQLELMARLHRGSRLIEEIYAVQRSLSKAVRKDLIKNWQLPNFEAHYKKLYDRYIPTFEETYNAFDFVVKKIGETAAHALIHTVLSTSEPTLAFKDIIFAMYMPDLCAPAGFEWNVTDYGTDYISKFSGEEAYDFFTKATERFDKDGSRYQRRNLLRYVERVEQEFEIIAQKVQLKEQINFLEHVYVSSNPTILSAQYSNFMYPISIIDTSKQESSEENVKHGTFLILLEAIRQQVITGKGLLCPFWMWDDLRLCCGGKNTEFLEKVWKCTADSTCKFWKPRGCLAKSSRPYRMYVFK
jgi:hypothetical protein